MSDEDLFMMDELIDIDEEDYRESREGKGKKNRGVAIGWLIFVIVLLADMINACARL